MDTLKLGTHGPPLAELSLVKTLFKLYSHGETPFRWTLADSGPWDAMLADANAEAALRTPEWPHADAILQLASHGTLSAPGVMERPIRSERLFAWLQQVEKGIPSNSLAKAPAVAETEGMKFVLLRWPPTALLRDDARLIRMATLLSRRAMKVSELAQLAQQPYDETHAFVQALQKAGLLGAKVGKTQPTSPASSIQPTRAPEHKRSGSLISRIRSRLGL